MRINPLSTTVLTSNCVRTSECPNQSFLNFKQKNAQNKIKVSVIIPVYNQEKYIAKALESLQNQSLKETEFICINDGSKDNSLHILQNYASRDSRIKIINQENQGAGCARNNGLKVAKGEYIAFLDPDDWFEPKALEELYNKSEAQNCDMVVFNFKKIGESGNELASFNLKNRLKNLHNITETQNFHWRDIKPKVFGGMYPTAWNKFYKNSLIKNNGLHFTKCSLAEDNVFVFGATLNAKNIGYLDKSLYNYLIHENSAIRSRSDKHLCVFKSMNSIKKLLQKMNLSEELKTEFNNYLLRIISFHAKQIVSVSKFRERCQKKLPKLVNERLKERFLANSKLFSILKSLIPHRL